MFGKPSVILSDNGPQYTGEAFKNFMKSWEIKHVTISPTFSQSNGFIERHVRNIKSVVKKSMKSGTDIQKALLNIRATPIDSNLKSPAELMFGHPITTLLPSRSEPGPEEQRRNLYKRQQEMIKHDKGRNNPTLPQLSANQNIRLYDNNTKMWIPGSIQRRFEEPRSYIVTTSNNSQLRRNRTHLREITVPNPATQHTRETEKSNRTTSFITTWWQLKNSINKLLGGQDRTAEVPNKYVTALSFTVFSPSQT